MLKTYFILLCFTFCSQTAFSQKWDNNLVCGYGTGPPNSLFGGIVISFSTEPPTITKFNSLIEFIGSAYISNSDGNLVAYSNGCSIANSNHEFMTNGTGISISSIDYDTYCSQQYGMPTLANLMLPYPEQLNKYFYLYHITQWGQK